MRFRILSILLLLRGGGLAQSRIQPSITPNGVVNAGSYIATGFPNQGIARGSMFLIFGSNLGPDTLVQATTLPLAGSDGLAGTRVRIDAGGYAGFALMVYTSARQVAAVLPSNAPEGEATLTLNYNNLTSNPVVIRIVRTAFGMFNLNQGGTGPAVAQNFVSAAQTPVNTLLTPATPGQTIILWGTGLGPVNGDEAAVALPGALPFLDALYVGGVPATVRYAGRSGCCIAVDQIVFDVPAGVSGCYVPVVTISGGLASNAGTIAVANGGGTCDDPLSFRGTALATLQRTGRLRVGQIELQHQGAPGPANGTNLLSANFAAYTAQTLAAVAPTPSSGTCLVTETLVSPNAGVAAAGEGLNAGPGITSSGPGGILTAAQLGGGKYAGSASPADLFAGPYSLTSGGGPDVANFQTSVTVGTPGQWTNAAEYTGTTLPTGQALTFRWTGGDPGGSVSIRIAAVNTSLATAISCNAAAGAGSFTVPAYLTRLLVQGEASVSLGFWSVPANFAATGLDVGTIAVGQSGVVTTNFRIPAGL